MTAAVKVLLEEWLIPRMNANKIIVTTRAGNIASARVFLKLGFSLIDTLEPCKPYPESKGGGFYGVDVLEWKSSE